MTMPDWRDWYTTAREHPETVYVDADAAHVEYDEDGMPVWRLVEEGA